MTETMNEIDNAITRLRNLVVENDEDSTHFNNMIRHVRKYSMEYEPFLLFS